MKTVFECKVPVPVSTNHLWKGNGRWVFKTLEYRTWLAKCTLMVPRLKEPIDGPVSVEITIIGGKGFRANRDIDNIIKPMLDFIREHGLIKDDNCKIVQSINVRYTPPEKKSSDASVFFRIEKLGA